MGLFTPKKSYYYTGTPSPGRTLPVTLQSPADTPPDDEEVEKKVYDKEKATTTIADPADAETSANTKLNALLYHISDDLIDRYRLENNLLDLLGRMYYDDYDPENRQMVERVASATSLSSLLFVSTPPVLCGLRAQFERPLYSRQVSFDTLSDSHHLLITLKVKHPQFRFRRNNKTILIGFSNDAESLRAVEWAFQQLVIHGDTIVVFQVLDDRNYKLVDPQLAEKVLAKLQKLNTHARRILLVYEVVIGKPQKLLKAAITEYSPAMMIVGTHQYGRTAIPTLHLSAQIANSTHHLHLHLLFLSKSSISKYFLQFALVPVILVKPFFEYHEELADPIDSPEYFHRLLASIDVEHTREKKKKHMFGLRSPLMSRNASSTSLLDLAVPEARGRPSDMGFSIGSRDSLSDRLRSHSRSRNEIPLPPPVRPMSPTILPRPLLRLSSRSRLLKIFS